MTLDIHLGWGAVAIVLTVLIWAWAILADKGPSGGDYNFGPALLGALHGLLAIIGTLAVWLAYFAARAFGWIS